MWVSFRVTILPVCESTIGRTILYEKAWSQPCVTFVMALSHRKPFALIQVEGWDDGMVHSNTLFTFFPAPGCGTRNRRSSWQFMRLQLSIPLSCQWIDTDQSVKVEAILRQLCNLVLVLGHLLTLPGIVYHRLIHIVAPCGQEHPLDYIAPQLIRRGGELGKSLTDKCRSWWKPSTGESLGGVKKSFIACFDVAAHCGFLKHGFQ